MQTSISYNTTKKDVKRKIKKLSSKAIRQSKNSGGKK